MTTTYQANINSASYRADQRPHLVPCDVCKKARATRRVAVYSGAQVTTFYACAECAKSNQ